MIRVRLSSWINEWMRENARVNRRSITGQIEYCLEQYIHHSQKTEKAPGSRQANPDASHAE